MRGNAARAGASLGGTNGGTPRRQEEPDDPTLLRLRHDLRQPLAAIRWSVDAVNGTDDVPVHLSTTLDQIGRQARWMERLLTEVLDAPGRVVVVDLADALADCCSTAPPSAPYELSFTKAGRVPVLVDPVGLERAARNLMDNAMRAVAGGGRIEVEVRARGTRGVLEVADSGPGFGALAPRQGHGLVGVHRFADRFGGDLAFGTSGLGGALVSLSLPRALGW
ncbi:MAG TPA: HAMP domain-containing sensor histidine kinase [Nocardioides sp.]|nr:HAMP domain-containing sensor histidine kinase [Nocardioides sp.]